MEDLFKKVIPGHGVSVQTGLGRWWRLPLLCFVFLIGFSSQLKAASDFATTSYNTVSHKPSITEPYIVVKMLFYDAKGSDSFFTHYKADGSHKGPAVYVDGNYICSPDWELAWPGGDGDNGGDGSDGYVADECWDNDAWWGNTYTKTVGGVKYTIKFWNPVRDSDDRRYVSMYVFMDKFLNNTTHTVTVKGRWRTNGSSPVAVNKEYTWNVGGFTLGVEGPSSIAMNGIGKMILSGNLRSQAYGAFTISTSDNYTTSSMLDNAPSKKEFQLVRIPHIPPMIATFAITILLNIFPIASAATKPLAFIETVISSGLIA